jgi:spore germination protein YaaH
MKPFLLTLALLAAASQCFAAAPVALFYLTNGPDSIRSFLAHSKQIDLLVPTWYSVDENGLVTGAPNPTVLKRANEDKVPLEPIVAMFNKKGFHALSMNATAQAEMNQAMIRECKAHGYIGFQFDLENVDYLDRDRLTALVKTSAEALHAAGLQLSIASVPNAPGYPGESGFEVDLHRLARRVRRGQPGQICRLVLPDDLRPEHSLDHAGPGRWLGLDDREFGLCPQIRAQREALAGHPALRLSLVCRHTHS